ncbi:GspH/FimT family protein [Oceanibacterium hippocampi]|uniref:Type II secretion system protein H n=1 Tax=Oceanibacterium hippocampi TaxID=745714 RepID=A0A1Y5TDJ2_9PROT|nr:GspH/FimT family protein [Oceanibacterium hippocampi]SLN57907.1 Type II transport protein GspH [Oceanibacterium hippocampi]
MNARASKPARQPMTGGLRASGGFTLLELVVALVVISFAFATVMPLLDRAIPGARLDAASTGLVMTLREARGIAIRDGREITVNFDAAARRAMVEGAATGDPWPNDAAVLLYDQAGRALTGTKARIVFLPDGSSSGGVIEIAATGDSRRLTVDWLTGRVRERH